MGPYPSFSNCGLPFYVGGHIAKRDSLFLTTPQKLLDRYRLDVRVNTEAIKIDRISKTIDVRAHDGEVTTLPFDRLILAQGADAIVGHSGVGWK
jgi:NADPH-dependent 2,4-dienoyl-CoA reductase/sulfur reductase-like enzyme/rhodanese-related sulfurtransferase